MEIRHQSGQCSLWNIHGAKPTDLTLVAELIAAESPDVIALPEVRYSRAAELAERLDVSSVWNKMHHPWPPLFPSKAEGAALISPHILSNTNHAAESDACSKRICRRRIVQWGLVERTDGSSDRVFNLHLSPHDVKEERRNEAARISAIACSLPDSPPPIVAGDLNDQESPEVITLLLGIDAVAPPSSSQFDAPTSSIDHV